MSDIIQLLPESIANQIAAGEVVQRPASVVKELMENGVDAGASEITLIVKDAGKSLVQVIDDGKGMSETDARMSFERHATSKIRKSEDLFLIKTMGFRGEALASIAAVAQVEMKSKLAEDEIGTSLQVDGSQFKGQSNVSCKKGTTMIVKNLFFNVPARRNFLKSNPVELRHIMDEFPDAKVFVNKFARGPGANGKIQARFSGPDSTVLRKLAGQAEQIMAADPSRPEPDSTRLGAPSRWHS